MVAVGWRSVVASGVRSRSSRARAPPVSSGSRGTRAVSGGQPGQYTRSLRRDRRSVGPAGVDLGPVERHAAVAQRDVRVVADDQVIEQLDVEKPPRGKCLGRQVKVIRGGGRVARWMVVDED